MRWAAFLLVGCASLGVRQRAERLETSASTCASFEAFDASLAKEREALTREARGDELVPTSRALTSARRRCANATIDGLFSIQEQRGRDSAVAEVQALTRAFGAEAVMGQLRERWGTGSDAFLADVALAASSPGPTPEQPTPTEPSVRPAPPSMPGAEVFGDGPSCLRRPTLEAARCLGEWRRDEPESALFDAAVTELVAKTLREAMALEPSARAQRLGDVLQGLAVARGRAAVEPLFVELVRVAEQLLERARAATAKGKVELAAATVRPLLFVDETRRRAEPFTSAAARRHQALATDAAHRVHAAQLHRRLAAWFNGVDAPGPALEPGRWSDARWDCALRKPSLPTLPGGFAARLTARCRVPAMPKEDDALQPLEGSTPRVRIEADVSVTCGGDVVSERLSVEELLLEQDDSATRPHALDAPLRQLVERANTQCREAAKREATAACTQPMEPLDRTQLETRAALRLGRWPECFVVWFTREYGVPPTGHSD